MFFQGYRLIFLGPRLVFMVQVFFFLIVFMITGWSLWFFNGSRWVFMVLGRFLIVPGCFSGFFQGFQVGCFFNPGFQVFFTIPCWFFTIE